MPLHALDLWHSSVLGVLTEVLTQPHCDQYDPESPNCVCVCP